MSSHAKDSESSSRPVRLDSNPDEIINTLFLATDGLFRNRSRRGKVWGGSYWWCLYLSKPEKRVHRKRA